MKRLLIGIVILLLLFFGWYVLTAGVAEAPTNVEPVNQAGGITYKNATADSIIIELPFPGANVSHDFIARGKARGPWYFEASFPVVVVDEEGNQLAIGIAQAQGEWMTEEFVAFAAPVTVPTTFSGPATILFLKDNPSGLPENDAYASFSIVISE